MKQGLIHIYTGDGKGKTTAAMGLAVRAAGRHKNVYILQFLKGRETGEQFILQGIPGVNFARAHQTKKFIFQMSEIEKEELKGETASIWQELKTDIIHHNELIILDEIMGVISNGLIELNQVIELLKEKPPVTEMVLTGRGAPPELMAIADYITEMKLIKHPYQQNIPARVGIEF